jgi:predicted nucleic acid-binding protein
VNVLIDTPVWSLALRRSRPGPAEVVHELSELVAEGRVVLIGPVRQELLSGIKAPRQFEMLRDHLRAFPDLEIETEDFEHAAQCFSRCRAKGIQGSNTDVLICAVALRRRLAVFTTDHDLARYARVLEITIHQPRS